MRSGAGDVLPGIAWHHAAKPQIGYKACDLSRVPNQSGRLRHQSPTSWSKRLVYVHSSGEQDGHDEAVPRANAAHHQALIVGAEHWSQLGQ